MNCSKCGAENPENVLFCSECGNSFSESDNEDDSVKLVENSGYMVCNICKGVY